MEYERYEFDQPLYGGVNVLRIGDALVDTGHVAPTSRDPLREALSGPLSDIERVVHTHPHIDHVGGSQTIGELADRPHLVPAGEPEIIYDYADYLRRAREEMAQLLSGFDAGFEGFDEYFPILEYAEERIDVVRELEDGDVIEIDGEELEAVSTPGHADPHLGFLHESSGTFFSGDLVDPDGLFQYGPLLGDVGDYKRSLRRVEALDPDVLVPMHGSEISDPAAQIERSLENAERTERRILAFLDERGQCYAREFVAEELGVDGPRAPFLTLVTYEYLRHLEERELVAVDVTDDGIGCRKR